MDKRVEEFKDFVRRYPGLKTVVRNGQATWQSLFEEWYLYGEDDGQWEKYKKNKPSGSANNSGEKSASKTNSKNSKGKDKDKDKEKDEAPKTGLEGLIPNISGTEMVTQAFNYIQKMDMNKVQQTMGTVQQFIQIFQTMSGNKAPVPPAGQKQSYPGLFSKFDD